MTAEEKRWVEQEIQKQLDETGINKDWIHQEIRAAFKEVVDKDWIHQEIQNAISKNSPSKLVILGPSIALLLAIIAGIVTYVRFQTHTEDRLDAIEERLKKIENLDVLLPSRVKQASDNPGDKKSQAEAKEVLETAKRRSISIPPAVIQSAGESFIKVSKDDPDAWKTALQFLTYSSFTGAPSDPQNKSVGQPTTSYFLETPDNYVPPQMSAEGTVPREQAAILRNIGANVNSGDIGNEYVLLDGGGLILDGMELKNVVLRGVHVQYKGGPLKLNGVHFLNCTFDIENAKNGILLAQDLLKALIVSFVG